MKRRLLKLGLLLLAGAIINVAVACALTYRSWKHPKTQVVVHDSTSIDVEEFGQFGWVPRVADEWHRYEVSMVERHSFGVTNSEVRERGEHQPGRFTTHGPRTDMIMKNSEAGWPMRTLYGEIWVNYMLPPTKTDSWYSKAWSSFQWEHKGAMIVIRESDRWLLGSPVEDEAHRVLPLRPILPGFAINTLFYSAILWVLFLAPFQLRRWHRLKRNLCPACAYPVGSSPICTECGKPVRVH